MLQTLVDDARIFFLILVRVVALTRVAPLFSSRSIPSAVRNIFTFFIALSIFPFLRDGWYPIPDNGLEYALLAIGEALIGIVTGYLLALIMAAFQLTGQLFSLQMGFGASQVFDPLAQIQIPLMGQFINLIAIFILIISGALQRILLVGVLRSFQSVRAVDFVQLREPIMRVVLVRLSRLFEQAMVMAFPIIGILFLVYISIGLIAKAAPQMNLLILGFPFSIGVTFLIIFLALPVLAGSFQAIFNDAIETLLRLFNLGSLADAARG